MLIFSTLSSYHYSCSVLIHTHALYPIPTHAHTNLTIPLYHVQIYFCLRTGYYDEARNVAQSSRVAHQFAPQVTCFVSVSVIYVLIIIIFSIVQNWQLSPSNWAALSTILYLYFRKLHRELDS